MMKKTVLTAAVFCMISWLCFAAVDEQSMSLGGIRLGDTKEGVTASLGEPSEEFVLEYAVATLNEEKYRKEMKAADREWKKSLRRMRKEGCGYWGADLANMRYIEHSNRAMEAAWEKDPEKTYERMHDSYRKNGLDLMSVIYEKPAGGVPRAGSVYTAEPSVKTPDGLSAGSLESEMIRLLGEPDWKEGSWRCYRGREKEEEHLAFQVEDGKIAAIRLSLDGFFEKKFGNEVMFRKKTGS